MNRAIFSTAMTVSLMLMPLHTKGAAVMGVESSFPRLDERLVLWKSVIHDNDDDNNKNNNNHSALELLLPASQ